MSLKVARYTRSKSGLGKMPASLRRASSGRRRSRLIQRATSAFKRRATMPAGLSGVAPSVMTFLRGVEEAVDPTAVPYVHPPTEGPTGVRRRSYGVPWVRGGMGTLRSGRLSAVTRAQAAGRAMDRSPSSLMPDSGRSGQIAAMGGEVATGQSLSPGRREHGPTVVQYRSVSSGMGPIRRYVSMVDQPPVVRASSVAEFNWHSKQYAPVPVSSGSPDATSFSGRGEAERAGMSFRGMVAAEGGGSQAPTAPMDSMDSPSHERPLIGAIHLDGNALGQWMTRHLERTLSQPNRGPSGVDPRVIPTWGPLSAAY